MNIDTITASKNEAAKPSIDNVKNKKTVKNKKVKPEKGKKKIDLKPVWVALEVILSVAGFSLLLFSSAVYAYKDQFSTKAYYGTKILGEEVGGKTAEEIDRELKKRLAELTITFNVDGQDYEIRPEEAGVFFKPAETAAASVKKEKWYRNYFTATSSLFYLAFPELATKINPTLAANSEIGYAIDGEKLNTFTHNLSDRFNVASKDAGLVMKGANVEVIPAVYGRKIVGDSVRSQIVAAIRNTKEGKITVDVEKVNPSLVEAETKESIEAAKALISLPVKFTYKDKQFTPDQATIGSWVTFKEVEVTGKKKLVPQVDPKLVYSYVYGVAGQINIAAVNKKVTIVNGAGEKVESEGKNGLAVDVDQAAAAAARNLSAGKGIALELPTYDVKYKTKVNNVVVADWAKYISVDLSDQRMCAYLSGGVKVDCWAITTGKNGMGTPIGTHLISRKSGEGGAPGSGGGGVCMPNPPSPYPLCGINYVSTFTSAGHAVHEAWWRSSFGGQDYKWNGSHGCVNSPYDVAKFIYYWAPIGTPVIVQA